MLVVEEARSREAHRDAIPVGCRDHVVVADGAAGLHDVGDAGPVGALDVVSKGEERVGAERDAVLRGNPLGPLLASEGLGSLGKPPFPRALS